MARTRRNGEPLTVEGLVQDARSLPDSDVEWYEWVKDLRSLLGAESRASFDEGMQLGARVTQRNAVEAVATAALHVLGKDIADGVIGLGALGEWWPSYDVAITKD